MRKSILIITLTAAALGVVPGMASAQSYCDRAKQGDRVVGTLVGAIGGALIGNAVAARNHRGDGALVGAAGGALIGNQLARSKEPCPTGYADDQRRDYDVPPPPPPREYSYRSEYVAPPPPPAYGARPDYRTSRYSDADVDRRRDYSYYEEQRDGRYRREERTVYGDGYGRSCHIESRVRVSDDGSYVRREERVCR